MNTSLPQASPPASFRLRQLILRHRWTELQTGAMRGLTEYPQSPRQLDTIRARLQVLLGEQDMPVTQRVARLLAERVPSATLHVLPDVGHLCLLEAPQPAAALIQAHLTSLPV